MKIFVAPSDYDKNTFFYSVFDVVYEVFRSNIGLYNKVRNYATKRYSTNKFKLNFANPTLANGWDKNKEYDNNAIIFIKNNKYYLGILNAKNKKKITETSSQTANCYKKMVYKLLPDPSKMLPKVFFSKKGLSTYETSEYIKNGYNLGKHKKGENFDLQFCHDLIDYFKNNISVHPDWSKFGFEFSDTESYEDISKFYAEISRQNYKMSFSYVADDEINNLVDNGSLFLFQIYNKDFSEYSTGNKNLHTLYWEQLFSSQNLLSPIIKLNGQAEIFYRPASIDNPFTHKMNDILINKKGVSDEEFEIISADIKNSLSMDKLKEKYPNTNFRYAPHDITKDKRYTKPSFSFHTPITLNYTPDNKFSKFNQSVIEHIKDNKDVNIIGIDRGERNLLYVSLIDQKGKILYQKSYNIVNGVDYHKKLDELEKERNSARKNWKTINKIADLKSGYLSAVIHEITDLMIENNAIIVMEDLNFGFKRGRFHIEKQVYQKFEKMLIDKLNYLANKKKDPYEAGGICKAYQLANEFTSFQKLGKQSGFIFYVPASRTSKIDFNTGFVNLFTSEQLSYSSIAKSKEFITSFDYISYDNSLDCFKFDFKYSNFKLNSKDYTDHWTVCTYGSERVVHYTDKNDATHRDKFKTVNVSEELKNLFGKYNIDYTNNDLISKIISINDKPFYTTLLWLFKITVQLRYENKETDYILSPVEKDGKFFDTRTADPKTEPIDGDANGAYHIALQGLRLLTQRLDNGKVQLDSKGMQAYNWFKFAQEKAFKK